MLGETVVNLLVSVHLDACDFYIAELSGVLTIHLPA